MLEKQGVDSYFFNWGGEMATRGRHPSGRAWRTSIVKPPTLSELFRMWRTGKDLVDKSKILRRVDLPDVPYCTVATSGDYYQGKKFGYFHIVNADTGMLCQASVDSVASVTIIMLGRGTGGLADALATSAMMLSMQGAHAWLHSMSTMYPIHAFYVVSRSGILCKEDPVAARIPPPIFYGGFSFSDDIMKSLDDCSGNVTLEVSRGDSHTVSTIRVASISPPLVSVLLPDPSLKLARFSLSVGFENVCSMLHQNGPVVIATLNAPSQSARELRKRFDLKRPCIIKYADAEMLCSSVAAVRSGALSFNAELHSTFGVSVSSAVPGEKVRISFDRWIVNTAVRNVAVCGDHVVVVCGLLSEESK